MLERLTVRGYRSLRELHVELGPLTTIVGANGCGKTNLYQSLQLLQAAAQGRLARTLANEGGVPSIIWAGAKRKKDAPVRVTVEVRFDDIDFSLDLGPVPSSPQERAAEPHFAFDPEVKEESARVREGPRSHLVMERKGPAAFLRDADGNRVTFGASLWSSESVLSQLAEPHRYPVLSELALRFGAWRFYHHFSSGPDAPARQPQVATRTPVLAGDGSDLAAALQTILYIGDADALRKAIATAFGGATLDILPEERLTVRLVTPGLARSLLARELSDGTLRYLCLLAAMFSPRPPPLLALNEPVTSLHSDLLQPLGEAIAQAAANGAQVLLTTHSEPLAAQISRSAKARRVDASTIRLAKRDGVTEIATE